MSGQAWYRYQIGKGYNAHGHTGVDLETPTGTPLTPLFAGTVTDAQRYPWGYQVVVKSNVQGVGEIQTVYAHLDRVDVHPGQHVGTQDRIGLSGGENLPAKYSNGPHTHIGIYRADVPVWRNLYPDGRVATVDPTPFVAASSTLSQYQSQDTSSSTSDAGDCGHYITIPKVAGQGGGTICFDTALDLIVRFGLVSTGVLIIVVALFIFVRQTPAAREATGRAVAGFRAAFPAINVASAVAQKPTAPAKPKGEAPGRKGARVGQ